MKNLKNIVVFLSAFTGLVALETVDQNLDQEKTPTLVQSQQSQKELKESIPAQECYRAMARSAEKGRSKETIQLSKKLMQKYPSSPYVKEVPYFIGMSFYQQQDLEIANRYLSAYLKQQTNLQFHREAVELKFAIAEKFRQGHKKHLAPNVLLPKMLSGKEDALTIYDEVAISYPQDEIAAKALLSKAAILFEMKNYDKAIEAYRTIINNFPYASIAPEAHLGILRIYLTRTERCHLQADCLDLAMNQLQQFKQNFSSDERYLLGENILTQIQEEYAKSFYKVAKYYEKLNKKQAAIVYYFKIIKNFPNTQIAQKVKEHLIALKIDPLKEVHEDKNKTAALPAQ